MANNTLLEKYYVYNKEKRCEFFCGIHKNPSFQNISVH